MRREIMNGQARTLNGSLPDVKIQCVPKEQTPLAPAGLLNPDDTEKKSFSHADIQFLAVAPKKKKGKLTICKCEADVAPEMNQKTNVIKTWASVQPPPPT